MTYNTNELARAREIIVQIAEKEGTTYGLIYSEIEQAMEAGMSSTDPLVQTRWQQIPCHGNNPTPEEFIIWAAHILLLNPDYHYFL